MLCRRGGRLSGGVIGQDSLHDDPIRSLRQASQHAFLRDLLNICPGMYFVLFTRTMVVLFCRSIARAEVHRVMIATAIVMWITATGVCNPHVSYATKPVADSAVTFSTFR